VKGTVKRRLLSAIALVISAAACSTADFRPAGRHDLIDARGHVIGRQETLRNEQSGEEIARLALYIPRHDARGELVGYEEPAKGGAILRNLNGKRIGIRWQDLRSRGSNPRSKGLTIVFLPPAPERVTLAFPSIEELRTLAVLAD
jgi:hypothetical protein